ncbi:hypothetical protein Tco_0158174 [Tanacetum coccineum]
MGYENLTQKLTFYKAFFSPQWKFLIHTILQCLSAMTTAWNEFSSTMASAIICLATNQNFNFSKYIFDNMVKNLDSMVKFLMYPRFVQVFLDKQVEGMSKHKEIYVTPSHTKKVFANMKRQGKGFSGRVTPLFPTMMVQAQEEMGKGSSNPTDPHHAPTIIQPSTSQPKKKHPRKSKKKNTKVPQPSDSTDDVADENVPTHSNDPLLSGEDRLKLNELMELCTNLSQRVLDLEKTKTSLAVEITELKERVKKLEKKGGSRTHRLRRLYKVGRSARVVSSEDEGLGNQVDASKQGRKIDEINQDAEVTLVDETQGRNGDNLMFDTGVLDNEEVFVEQDMAEKEVDIAEKDVSTADPIPTASEVVTTANVEVSTARLTEATITDELTLAQTLIEIKSAKPKAKGIIFKEPVESTTTTTTPISLPKPPQDKGKAKMIESEKPLKKKDQIMFDKEVAQKLQAQLEAELEEEDKLARQREEDANIAEWDDVQAMMDADYELTARLQAEEQGELTIEEKSRLFVELMDKRKKHFAKLRGEGQRRKPPTKAQKRKTISTYLKNMAGYKHNQLKNKTFDDIQKLFDKEMKRVNTFVDMDTELTKGNETRAEGSSKRAGEDLQQESTKKQKVDDDDKEEEDLKQCFELILEEEVAINAILLATKPAHIVNFQIHTKGKQGYYEIIRADGSSKIYLVFNQLLKEFVREDLEILWRLVKTKHGNTRPEEGYERVLWGDLKVMFEPDVESEVWRNLQGHKVTVWKLFDSCGVHFVRFQNLHIYKLVEKTYPLTPATIIDMLNKKLQADHWNEMCYQLLKLMTKQQKKK